MSSTPSKVLIRCRGLEVGYSGRAVLPKIDIEIRGGEFWAVIGRNGSGKSTLLRTLLGLLPPVAGRVERVKTDLELGYLPQRKIIEELYPLAARDVVHMGLQRRWSFLGTPFRSEPPEVERAMQEMGVAELASVPYRRLSEGQKQRVLFARLAVSGAGLAVLDEPTSAMDQVAERDAFERLDALRRRQGMAIVIVSHYLAMVEEVADFVVLLDRDAQSVVTGPPRDVFSHRTFRTGFSDRPPPAAEDAS